MAIRKGFTWTRKKAWAICKGKRVVDDDDQGFLVVGSRALADRIAYEGEGETVRSCEIIVKVKGD